MGVEAGRSDVVDSVAESKGVEDSLDDVEDRWADRLEEAGEGQEEVLLLQPLCEAASASDDQLTWKWDMLNCKYRYLFFYYI